jgi:alanyl-tRNA synthetase
MVEVPGFSIELCGGTHAESTGAIGLVKLTSEGSVSAGVRRVECTTGLGSLAFVRDRDQRLREAADALGGPVDQLLERIQAQKEQAAALRRQLAEARRSAAGGALERLLGEAREVSGVPVVAADAGTGDVTAVKALVDQVSERLRNGIVVLAGAANGSGIFVAKASPAAVDRGAHAGNLVREVAKLAGGGGGGRPEFAQAGAKDTSRIGEALAAVPDLVTAQLGAATGQETL